MPQNDTILETELAKSKQALEQAVLLIAKLSTENAALKKPKLSPEFDPSFDPDNYDGSIQHFHPTLRWIMGGKPAKFYVMRAQKALDLPSMRTAAERIKVCNWVNVMCKFKLSDINTVEFFEMVMEPFDSIALYEHYKTHWGARMPQAKFEMALEAVGFIRSLDGVTFTLKQQKKGPVT